MCIKHGWNVANLVSAKEGGECWGGSAHVPDIEIIFWVRVGAAAQSTQTPLPTTRYQHLYLRQTVKPGVSWGWKVGNWLSDILKLF